MRILDLYQDYGIPVAPEGHKHGGGEYGEWINTECPFCTGSPGYHLGYNVNGDYFHCWRCGGKFTDTVIVRLLHVSYPKAKEIVREYGGSLKSKKVKEKVEKTNQKPFQFPSGDLTLRAGHRKYLTDRGFNPDQLHTEWGVTGTGPIAKLDDINYSKRILIPIKWKGEVVSFQTRAIRNQHPLKYIACPQEREIIAHQKILYGNEQEWKNRRGVCVEGVFDVWRFGVESFGVFGIEFSLQQLREMSRRFDNIAVAFDPEPQAIQQANLLVAELKLRGVEAFRIDLPSDPAEMQQDDADYLMKNIFK